jgi:F-type H+-transporting ATPase subunit b
MSPSVRLLGRWLGLAPNQAANLFEALNFATVAVTLLVIAWKYLPKLVKERKSAIQRRLTEARTAAEEANRRLASIEQKLARLDLEIGEIRDRAERESAEDEERFKNSVERERTRIVQSAEREIAAAGASAQRELRLFAGRVAIERAEQRLALPEADDRRLILEMAEELGGQGRNGGRN